MVGESPGSEKAPGICASSEEAVVLVDPKVLVVVLRLRDIADVVACTPQRYAYRLMITKLSKIMVGWVIMSAEMKIAGGRAVQAFDRCILDDAVADAG